VNILQRKMFANGDVATTKQSILPLYEKHAKQLSDSKKGIKNQYGGSGVVVEERGQDPIFDSFLDRYGITPEQYSQIHQQAGNRVIYDPGLKMSAPLLEMAGGKGILQGIGSMLFKKGAKETGKFVATPATGNMGPPLVTPITKEGYQLTNPGRFTAGAVSLPLLSGSAVLPEDETIIEAPLTALDQTQVELDKIAAEQSAAKKTKAEQEKANKLKTKQEIADINKLLENLNIKEKEEKESFIEKRKERKNRNTGIFLNEMSKAMAATDNLADGIAIGAANSSDAVMQADELERLEGVEAGKDLKKLMTDAAKDGKVSDQDWQDLTKRYQESARLLGKQTTLLSMVDELYAAAGTGDVTGINGVMARLVDDISGFTGKGGEVVSAATEAVNKGKYLTAQSITDILQEGGKTVSDRDRDLIKDIMANFESWTMTPAEAQANLARVRINMQQAFSLSQADLNAIKQRFGGQIPELKNYDQAYGLEPKNQGPAANEFTLDPTLIKPIG
jgi:hypothetical protein